MNPCPEEEFVKWEREQRRRSNPPRLYKVYASLTVIFPLGEVHAETVGEAEEVLYPSKDKIIMDLQEKITNGTLSLDELVVWGTREDGSLC